ncbi:peptidylprolyl isomerase [Alkalisalibacterium limincola]|uniref:peptidylprolyl isomerase n=1 Tax=Alkalisalibacterium limincola TaxID=2699169 RepID=A0A5C8KYV6_9GAMM|nr:peptidylprolyl isomerase [Alkalisalibacterium limincola]TXK66007.1 peptidylprolyl isomerase [Alkalisalibacterium limincola]
MASRFNVASACGAAALVLALGATGCSHADTPERQSSEQLPTTASVLAAASEADWRGVDPGHTLYMDFADGARVVIELAPGFAPRHAANIQALVRAGWFDGALITRSQDNYVAQWGRPDDVEAGDRGEALDHVPAEFDRALDGLGWTSLEDGDVYAPQVGWVDGFPAARDPATGRAWLAHCYGMVGAGRGMAADSSDGSQLYAVTGHSPRHLDRNITVVGRVLSGIEHLSALPRGTGALGFYEEPGQRVPITRVVMAADLPASERLGLQVLRTDTETFEQLIRARRHRNEDWFIDPVGRVELCNVPLPVRTHGG